MLASIVHRRHIFGCFIRQVSALDCYCSNNKSFMLEQQIRECHGQTKTDNENIWGGEIKNEITLDKQPQEEIFRHGSPDTLSSMNIERGVPKSMVEYHLRKRLKVVQPDVPRLSRVAILGAPNVGKSTLTNELIGMKVSSVSSKVHTTRHRVLGVLVEDDVQVEFLDTPGVVTTKHCRKHKLEPTFMSDPSGCMAFADVVAVVSDVTNLRDRERINPGILQLLHKHGAYKKSILILNKIDQVKEKRKLLDISTRLTCGIVGGVKSFKISYPFEKAVNKHKDLEEMFQRTEQILENKKNEIMNVGGDEHDNKDLEKPEEVGYPHFAGVFMTSALYQDGVEAIKKYLIENARFQPWRHHDSHVTDQSPQDIASMTVRAKCLDLLPHDIPYNIRLVTHTWEVNRAGNLDIMMDIICPERGVSMLIGPKGKTIALIVDRVKHDLQNTFQCDVNIKIAVKAEKPKSVKAIKTNKRE